jgi:hypothetical protein
MRMVYAKRTRREETYRLWDCPVRTWPVLTDALVCVAITEQHKRGEGIELELRRMGDTHTRGESKIGRESHCDRSATYNLQAIYRHTSWPSSPDLISCRSIVDPISLPSSFLPVQACI